MENEGAQNEPAAAPAAAVPAPPAAPAPVQGAPVGEDLLSPLLKEVLREYRAYEGALIAAGQAKPDTVANRELCERLRPPHGHGHIAGMPPGTVLRNRGEVAILGGHTLIFCGIDSHATRWPQGALAIVLSGGYRDDCDDGLSFWYTGHGGQGKTVGIRSIQVKDQEWHKGNLALRRSFESQLPVRVWRGSLLEGTKRTVYTYEGLHMVKEAKREASQDGPLVCKFLMVGVPGESVVSMKVAFQAMKHKGGAGGAPRMRYARLAGGHGKRGRSVPQETPELLAARRKDMVDHIALRPQFLQVADLSGGAEDVPIPVFNEVNGRRLVDEQTLEYVRDFKWAQGLEAEVAPVLALEEDKLAAWCDVARAHCGAQFSKAMRRKDLASGLGTEEATPDLPYLDDGKLQYSEPFGVHECGDACIGHHGKGNKACLHNRTVTNGVRLPLEVFMTSNNTGWGVRCAVDIPTGAYVASYIGLLITNDMGNLLEGFSADYVMGLIHLQHNQEMVCEDGNQAFPDVPPHKVPPPPHFASLAELRPVLAARRAAEDAAVAEGHHHPHRAAVGDTAAATGAAAAGAALEAPPPPRAEGSPEPPASAAAVEPPPGAATGGGRGCQAEDGAAEAASRGPASGPASGPTSAGAAGATAAAAMELDAPQRGPASSPAGRPANEASGSGGRPAGAESAGAGAGAPASSPAGRPADEAQPPHPLLLSIDAGTVGNVARFINHCCGALGGEGEGGGMCTNLQAQPVYARKARSGLLYYQSFFAARNIRAGEELLYDYGYIRNDGTVEVDGRRVMDCHCGATKCPKSLIVGDVK